MIKHWVLPIIAFIIVTAAAVGLAGTQVTLVNSDVQHGSVAFSAVDTADITSTGAYPAVPVALNGHKTVFVSPLCSGSAATLKVALAVGNWDANSQTWTAGPFWVQTGTLTADSTIKSNGSYVVPGAELTVGGYDHFAVHLDSLSTGTCIVGWSAY